MYCPECRTELPDDSKYCIGCGYDFTRIKTPPEKKRSMDSLDLKGTLEPQEIDTESFKAGSLFANRYEILSEGRKGGMGVVYKCNDTKLEEIVALKVIHPRLISSSNALTRFRQEVSISRKLNHENIVRVFNLEEWEGKEYFTMEWVEGKSLREILTERKKKNKPFTLEEAYQIISQLADSLHYAHKHTIHRDIKPENILITGGDELKVKLTDFGIAKMLSPSQLTTTSVQMGTPYYMAPEQKFDAAHVDKRADIYAVGVVLFELFILENTIGPELPSDLNKEVPKEVDFIYRKAVAKRPESRYGDISELDEAVKGVIQVQRKKAEEEAKKAEEKKKREEEKKKQEEKRIRAQERRIQEEELKRKEDEERKKQKEDQTEKIADYIDPVTGMEFVFVKGGSYQMGDTIGGGREDEKPVHEVCVDDFYLGKYPVTQGQWVKIMGKNPSYFKSGDNYPVESVSWDDVQEFIKELNQMSGQRYRLPTEAEWEYAARSGGKREKYAGTSSDSELGDYAWYTSNSGDKTHPVGQKRPNGLGLYDMSGNVLEWVEDLYIEDAYKHHVRNNPVFTGIGSHKIVRGGGWNLDPMVLRCSCRFDAPPGIRESDLGFRLLRTK